MSNTHAAALERATALTAFQNIKLRNKLRKVPHESWTDTVARDFVLRMIGNQPILDEHIAALGKQTLEPNTLENAIKEIIDMGYMRECDLYARNVMNQVALGDIDALHTAMNMRPSTVGMGGSEHISESFHQLLQEVQEAAEKDNKGGSIHIPFSKWHNAWGGLAAASLHVIAGDPGGGKSAVVEMLELALTHPDVGKRAGVMSMEMQKKYKLGRYAQHLYGSSVGPRAIGSGTTDLSLMQQALRELQEHNLFLDDTKYQRYGLADAMFAMKDKFDVDFFTVDFLQLMTAYRGESRYDNTSNNIMAIFDVARETGCPTIVLSQMNREGRKAAERPRMTDLEGAGTIEQLAHTVNFLWDKNRISHTNGSDSRTWVIDKNRAGPAPMELGDFKFDGDTMNLAM